ncbi:MAG: P-II family nitrogen regulator [Cyclobacteriaceae bacterium]
MKLIKAIIRTEKFEEVSNALQEIGVEYFTFFNGQRIDKSDTQTVSYRGRSTDQVVNMDIMEVQVVIADNILQEVVVCIKEAAYTGLPGDGRLFISSIENSITIE